MIIGLVAYDYPVQTYPRDPDTGELVPEEDGSFQAILVTPEAAWLHLAHVGLHNVNPDERRVTGHFDVFESREAAETGAHALGQVLVDAAVDEARHPDHQAWDALVGKLNADGVANELISNGLPAWWATIGHQTARISPLLSSAQRAGRLQDLDYDKVLGLVRVEVWRHGLRVRDDLYGPNDIIGYEPSGGPIPRDGALPPVSEYYDRPDDPAGRKTLVWWHRDAGVPTDEIPDNLNLFPVYTYKRRSPAASSVDVEKRDREWREAALTRALHVCAAGIIAYYAPQYPQHDPATKGGQRALLDLERGYLVNEQTFFVARGGTGMYAAIVASDKPWLDLPGQGGFATLRDRVLDELTPWAP